jgi:hypothetical protein
MRLTKQESHKHRAVKFVKRFAWVPMYVQSQWIVWEHYYTRYEWLVVYPEGFEEKIGYETASFKWRMPNKRFDEHQFVNEQSFDRSTHNWTISSGVNKKLPEDKEVQDWLLKNSPLSNALKE